jgi:enterobacterial common antigen flippase
MASGDRDVPDDSSSGADPATRKPPLFGGMVDSAPGEDHSYQQMLRSWSVLGGSSSTNYLISLIRVKILAIILGPSGIGLIGLYTSAIDLFSTVPNGISNSGVREIARASGAQDARAIARSVQILRWAGLIIGMLGWLLAILLAKPIDVWLLHSEGHVIATSILGGALFLNALSASSIAVLKGLRRVKYLALTNVLSALLTTSIASILYYVFSTKAIVPVLVLSAGVNFGLISWFSNQVELEPEQLGWRETVSGMKYLLHLGVAFIMATLVITGLDMLTRLAVANMFGIHAAGIYQAALTISGTFMGVVLAAVAADFYPRLSAVIHDQRLASRLVNRQLELGVLLSLPILLTALAFAPVIMTVLYSSEFVGGAGVLRWLMLGVFLKVLSWPIGFLPLAKRAMLWVLLSQAVLALVQVPLLFWLGPRQGLIGVAQASVIALLAQGFFLMWMARQLVGFSWTASVQQLILIASGLIVAEFLCPRLIRGDASFVLGALIALFGALMSMRVLAERLEWDNPVVRCLSYMPGIGMILAALK